MRTSARVRLRIVLVQVARACKWAPTFSCQPSGTEVGRTPEQGGKVETGDVQASTDRRCPSGAPCFQNYRRTGFALILIDGLLLLPVFGVAQEPSFDCAKAKAPALTLVCADPELRRLSGLLGQAYAQKLNAADESERNRLKSEQKAWIAARNQRCGLPAKGSKLDIEQLWDAAPCLADTYRERLAAFGSLERPAGAPPVSTTSRFIHPSCVEAALNEGARPIAIAACNRASRHIPVELRSGELSAPGGCCGIGFSYTLVGTLADGREVAIVSDQTGSGAFGEVRSIVVLDRTRGPA